MRGNPDKTRPTQTANHRDLLRGTRKPSTAKNDIAVILDGHTGGRPSARWTAR